VLPLRFTRRGLAAAAAATATLIVVRHRAATTCRCPAAAYTCLGAALSCHGRVVLAVEWGGKSAVVSTCKQGRSSACNQRTLRWSWMTGPRVVRSFGCTSHWHMSVARVVDAKDLSRPSSCDQRCTQRQLEGPSDAIKGLEEARPPAIALTGGSGNDRRNQVHSG
jgi:hypothetical protein